MDGNGRWAKLRNLSRNNGHVQGIEATRITIEHCIQLGIENLTLFAFSTENWNRPGREVDHLLALLAEALENESSLLLKNNVKVNIVGNREDFSEDLQKAIAKLENVTQANKGLRLFIAAGYGGRWDITNAVRTVANKVSAGTLSISDITEDSFSEFLSLGHVADPDLFIRTGGEQRISNYLLWQLAYSELYFTDCLWPDFGEKELEDAIKSYLGRQRRFGLTGE
jgi:undecaprenyl diphosphate synthase